MINKKGEHWNRDWEYIAYHFCNKKVANYDTEKENFIGQYGDLRNPKVLTNGKLKKQTGKWNDPIGSLQVDINLLPGQEKEIVFVLGIDTKKQNVNKIKKYYSNLKNVNKEFDKTKEFWQNTFNKVEVETPDPSMKQYFLSALIFLEK